MPKNLNLSLHKVSTESIVLKLPPNAKKNLEYFFNAMNFIYSQLKKNSQVNDINLFLLSLKPKIDGFIGTKNKAPIYKLLNIAINQWLQEDTGVAYLRLDQPSQIRKQYKISIPLQNCNDLDFICPDIYKRTKSALYNPYIKIMKINNIFIAEVIAYYPIKIPVVTTPKRFYIINDDNQILNVDKNKFNDHNQTLKYKKSHNNRVKYRPKNSQTIPIQANDISKLSFDSNSPAAQTQNKHPIQLKANQQDQEKISAWFEFRKKFQENSKSIDSEIASEILEAFKEVKARRSTSNNEYLQNFYKNGALGKFGLPQAKWRNGTYGINSKEPDFFNCIDK